MADSNLVKQAKRLGISTRYRSEAGEPVDLSDKALTALIDILEPFGDWPKHAPVKTTAKCPTLPRGTRLWGVTCQLYGLRSARNRGIGDFADLARLASDLSATGAAFIGLNPLTALFMADPSRISPYSPSTRHFLNPLYLALDWIEGGEGLEPGPKAGDLVDYPAVTRDKRAALRLLFDRRPANDPAFEAYRDAEGEALEAFAVFETLSARHMAAGDGPGWRTWPEAHRRRSDDLVARVMREEPDAVLFHQWLQYLADAQLTRVQQACRDAGMAIGLYLDIAIGVAPDGFDTWADPELTTPGARIGSPPDPFNADGQDWGLAPIVPSRLAARDFEPYRGTLTEVMRHAGAVRIDHAMALERLWWIPEGHKGAEGGYVRYPFGAMATTLAEVARKTETIVIGEDLGTVPPGFRARAAKANIHSYRVLYFEKGPDGFTPPGRYPTKALASISTHDLPTLSGWWSGADIAVRAGLGLYDRNGAARVRKEREAEKLSLLALLEAEGLAPKSKGTAFSAELAAAVHALLARSPSMLVAVQLEDLLGLVDQPNLPGTVDEHPNWRRIYPVAVDAVTADPTAKAIIAAVVAERGSPRRGGSEPRG